MRPWLILCLCQAWLLLPSLGAAVWPRDCDAFAQRTLALFRHGFDAYMRVLPADELLPLTCQGLRAEPIGDGPIDNITDTNGDYFMTLVDTMPAHVIFGNETAFREAVEIVKTINFDKDVVVKVFECAIRVLGGLLSAHLFASDARFAKIPGYRDELLMLAQDLGQRLLPAFERSPSGIPFARINLQKGLTSQVLSVQQNTASATTLYLEFTVLSRLTNDSRFEEAARRSLNKVWNMRSQHNLVGYEIDIAKGVWIMPFMAGIGAGADSFYEIALKASILFDEDMDMFIDAYEAIMQNARDSSGFWYRNVGLFDAKPAMQTTDSLSAFWPGMQVLYGDLDAAIKSHLAYWNLWRAFSGLPEVFNIQEQRIEVPSYPLRPEFLESNYFLYLVTRDDFYLDVAARALDDLERRTKVDCGLANMVNVLNGTLEDKMESFVLSETLKYLYLTFNHSHWLNRYDSHMVFSTEAHLMLLKPEQMRKPTHIHRMLRLGAKETCPIYTGTSLADVVIRPPHGQPFIHSLLSSIPARDGYDQARYVAGVPLTYVQDFDSRYWSPYGVCAADVGLETYYFDVAFPDLKIKGHPQVERVDAGLVVHSLSGLVVRLSRRLDGTGFQISHLGSHRVHVGQDVLILDWKAVGIWTSSASQSAQYSQEFLNSFCLISLQSFSSMYNIVGVMASFGPSPDFPASASLALHYIPTNPQACLPITYARSNTTQILLADRGNCTFAEKGRQASNGGFEGVIVIQSTDEPAFSAGLDPELDQEPDVPVMMVSRAEGRRLLAAMQTEEPVRVRINHDEATLQKMVRSQTVRRFKDIKTRSQVWSRVTSLIIGEHLVTNAFISPI